jgi:hypothetical protein
MKLLRMSEPEKSSCGVEFKQELACDVCGCFGAFVFDGKNLCTDCYEAHGSCCPEFNGESKREPDGAK